MPIDELGTIDDVVTALYRVLTFGPGEMPDLDGIPDLFLPEARLVIPTGARDQPVPIIAVEVFVQLTAAASERLSARGFQLQELNRHVVQTQTVAQVLSIYDSRYATDDGGRIGRGVYSLQLVRSTGRWWIAGLVWDRERSSHPLPEHLLES